MLIYVIVNVIENGSIGLNIQHTLMAHLLPAIINTYCSVECDMSNINIMYCKKRYVLRGAAI